jgi:hypothetical protein
MRALLLGAVAVFALAFSPRAAAWSWPVDGPVLRPFVFGGDPYQAGQHRGIDIGAPGGATVAAPAGGTVSFVGTVPGGGAALTIRAADGYSVTLVHLGSIGVIRGAVVEEGAAVGTVGPSGDAEWPQPYLHLGVRVTADPHGYVDPLGLLPARPVPVPTPAPDEVPDEEGSASGAGHAEERDVPADDAPSAGAETETPVDEPASELPADEAPSGTEESGADEAPAGEEAGSANGADQVTGDSSQDGASGDEQSVPDEDTEPSAGEDDAGVSPEAGETAAGGESGSDAGEEAGTAETSPSAEADNAGATEGAAGSDVPAPPEMSLPGDDPPVIDEGVPEAESPAASPASAPTEPAVPTETIPATPSQPANDPATEPAADAPAAPADVEVEPAPAAVSGGNEALELRGRFPVAEATLVSTDKERPASDQVRLQEAGRESTGTGRSASPHDAIGPGTRAGESPAAVAALERPAERAATAAQTVDPHVAPVRGEVPEARLLGAQRTTQRSRWRGILLAGSLLGLALAVAALVRRARSHARREPEALVEARIISALERPDAASAEDPGRGRLALRERSEAHRPCGGIRRPVGHLRPLPPPEGQRRPDGERDGRARDADHGRGGQRGRLAA